MSTKDDDKQTSANDAGSDAPDAKNVADAEKTSVSSDQSATFAVDATLEKDTGAAKDTAAKETSSVKHASDADKHSADTHTTSGNAHGASVTSSTISSAPASAPSSPTSSSGHTVSGGHSHSDSHTAGDKVGSGSGGGAGASRASEPSKPHGKHNIGQWLLVVLVVLVVILLLGVGWNLQRMNQQHDSVNRLNARISHLEQQSNDQIQQALSSGQQSNQQLTQRIDQNDQTVQKVLAQLNRHQQSSPSDWTYAEVEYLLRIANQRLALQRDVAGAQHLLTLADQRLASTQNPAFIPVRGAIHSELADLDSVNAVDTDGIYLQLAAEQQQFNSLPLAQDTQALSAKEDNSATFSGGWRTQLGRLGQQLEDLVTIRHHDKPLEALITPQQEGYLRANISLLLEQAQIALLNQDEDVFKGSLSQALNLINQYYEVHDGGVEKATQRIQSLAQINVRPSLPDISGSLNQLQSILSQRGSASNSNQGE